ncbi:hypothetical protein VQ056_25615 [Paenibacillus sp. JTLBN-2024]
MVANGASVNNITITGITDAKGNALTPFSQPVVWPPKESLETLTAIRSNCSASSSG